MADKLIKILIEAENKASDQFKALIKELKKTEEQAKKTAESLKLLDDNKNSETFNSNNKAIDKNTKALKENENAAEKNSQANKNISSNFGSVLSVAGRLTAVVTALAGAYGLAASKAIDLNKELIANSSIAGTNIKDFQKLAFVYKNFGVEASDIASAIKDVNERINDAVFNNAGEFVDVAKALGLDPASLAELGRANPAAAYEEVLEVLTKIEDKNVRQAFADRIGSDALNKLVSTTVQFGEEINKLGSSFENLNLGITEEQSKKILELSSAWSSFADNFLSLSNEVLIESIPNFLKLIEIANEFVTDLRNGTSENFNLLKSYFTFLGTEIPLFFIKAAKEVGELNLKILEMLNLQELSIAQRQRISELNRKIASITQESVNNAEKTRLQYLSDTGNKLKEEEDIRLKILRVLDGENISIEQKTLLLENAIKLLGEENRLVLQLKEGFKQAAVEASKIGEIEIVKTGGIQGIDAVNNQLINKGKEGQKLTTRNKFEIERLELSQSKQEITKLQESELNKVSKFLNDNDKIIKVKQELFVGFDENKLKEESNKVVNRLKDNNLLYIKALKEGDTERANVLKESLLKDFSSLNIPEREIKKSGEIIVSSFNAGLITATKEQDIKLSELSEKYKISSSGAAAGIISQSQATKDLNELITLTGEIYGKQSAEYKDLMNERANINKDLFQKEIDNVNYLRDSNQITIDEQIASLEKLRNQVGKNSDEYKDLSIQIQSLNLEKFDSDINRTSMEIDLNRKSVSDLIAIYEKQLTQIDKTSDKYLELEVIIKSLKDQQLSEEFQKIDLQMQLHEATIDDVIAKYKALAASTTAGSLENLQARVGQQGAEQAKTDENKDYINAQLDSENLSYERRNELLTQYQNILIQQRDQLPENTAQYVELNNQIQSLNGQFSVLGVTYAEIASTIADAGTDAFMSWIEGSKSLKDAFKDMALSIIQDFIQMTIRAMIYNAIASAMGMPTGGGGMGAGGGLSSLFSGGGGATASLPTRHNGGPVGTAGDSSNGFKSVNLLNPSKSLSSNERLIVAKTDEYVVNSPTVNSPTGVGSNTVASPNVSIANYISDRAIGDMFSNSDHLNDTIVNIINKNQDKISIR